MEIPWILDPITVNVSPSSTPPPQQVEPVPQVETKSERPVGSLFRRKSCRVWDLTEAHGEEIEELFDVGLHSIRNIKTARITKLNRDGDVIDLGPDTDCILATTNLLLTLSIRGRKLLTSPTPEHISPTWEQLCRQIQENTAKGEDGSGKAGIHGRIGIHAQYFLQAALHERWSIKPRP